MPTQPNPTSASEAGSGIGIESKYSRTFTSPRLLVKFAWLALS
jgi:hypothetical protein